MHKRMSGFRKPSIYIGVLLLISVHVFVFVVGCATPSSKSSRSVKKEESAYNKATKKNTIESYKEFIEKYPGSANTENAKRTVVKLAWEKAKAENTVEAYTKFIEEYKEYPSYSNYRKLARQNIKALTKKSVLKNVKNVIGKKLSIKRPRIDFLKDVKSKTDRKVYTRFIKSVKRAYDGSSAIFPKDLRIFRKSFWIDLLSHIWKGVHAFFESLFSPFEDYRQPSPEEGKMA